MQQQAYMIEMLSHDCFLFKSLSIDFQNISICYPQNRHLGNQSVARIWVN